MKRRETEALYDKRKIELIATKIAELFEAEEIFANTDAGMELSKTRALKNKILLEMAGQRTSRIISGDSLELFHQVSELISRHLGDEDFAEKVLDLVLTIHVARPRITARFTAMSSRPDVPRENSPNFIEPYY